LMYLRENQIHIEAEDPSNTGGAVHPETEELRSGNAPLRQRKKKFIWNRPE